MSTSVSVTALLSAMSIEPVVTVTVRESTAVSVSTPPGPISVTSVPVRFTALAFASVNPPAASVIEIVFVPSPASTVPSARPLVSSISTVVPASAHSSFAARSASIAPAALRLTTSPVMFTAPAPSVIAPALSSVTSPPPAALISVTAMSAPPPETNVTSPETVVATSVTVRPSLPLTRISPTVVSRSESVNAPV